MDSFNDAESANTSPGGPTAANSTWNVALLVPSGAAPETEIDTKAPVMARLVLIRPSGDWRESRKMTLRVTETFAGPDAKIEPS